MNISFDISSIYNSGSDFLYKLRTIDLHACGEPARVVISGMPDIEASCCCFNSPLHLTFKTHFFSGALNGGKKIDPDD